MIHVDTLKKFVLIIILGFVAWNWAVAENEVRNLTLVGSSLGQGWRHCLVTLEPQVAGLEALTTQFLGLPRAEGYVE